MTGINPWRIAGVCVLGAATAGGAYAISPPVSPPLILLVWAAVVVGVLLDLPVALCVLVLAIPFDSLSILQPPLSLSLSDVLLIVVILRSLPLLVRREAWTRRSLNPYLLLLFLIWIPSIITALQRPPALRLAITLGGMLAMGAAVGMVCRKAEALRKLTYAFLLSVVMASVLGLTQWALYHQFGIELWHPRKAFVPELQRWVFLVTSVFEGRNVMAAMLVAAIAISLQLWRDRGVPTRTALVAVMALSVTIILMSLSRSGRGVAGMVFIAAALGARRRPLLLRLAAALSVAFMTLVLPPQLLHVKIMTTPAPTAAATPVKPPVAVKVTENVNPRSNQERKVLLMESIKVIKTRPLTGVGAGCFERMASNPGMADPPNTYLQVATAAGIPTLLVFLVLVGVVLVNLVRALRAATGTHRDRAFALGALGFLAVMLVQGVFDELIFAKTFWLAVGMASGATFMLGSGADEKPSVAVEDAMTTEGAP